MIRKAEASGGTWGGRCSGALWAERSAAYGDEGDRETGSSRAAWMNCRHSLSRWTFENTAGGGSWLNKSLDLPRPRALDWGHHGSVGRPAWRQEKQEILGDVVLHGVRLARTGAWARGGRSGAAAFWCFVGLSAARLVMGLVVLSTCLFSDPEDLARDSRQAQSASHAQILQKTSHRERPNTPAREMGMGCVYTGWLGPATPSPFSKGRCGLLVPAPAVGGDGTVRAGSLAPRQLHLRSRW